MPPRSCRFSIVQTHGTALVTGPMALAGLAILACVLTRLSGLDRMGTPFCYFKALTGYACLTCGTTRALGHLSRLDVSSAFSIQPLVTAGTIGILLWGAIDLALLPGSRRTLFEVEGRPLRAILIVGAALSVLNWMYLLATGV